MGCIWNKEQFSERGEKTVITKKHPRIFSSNLSRENCTIGKGFYMHLLSASVSDSFDFPLTCINIDDIYKVLCSRELYLIYFPFCLLLFCYHGETIFLKLSIIKYLRLHCC